MTVRYLSSRAAARYLGLADTEDEQAIRRGVAVLHQWVHRRRVPFIKIGRRLRFDVRDLDRVMEEAKKEITQ